MEPKKPRKIHALEFFTPEQLIGFGCIATHSAALEIYLESCVWELCKLRFDQGMIFTENASFHPKTLMVRKLLKGKMHPSYATEIDTIMNAITDANTKRNILIHGLWFGDSGKGEAVKVHGGRNRTKVPADDAMSIAEAIVDGHRGLVAFFKKHRKLLKLKRLP